MCTHTNGAVPRTPPDRPSYDDVVASAIDALLPSLGPEHTELLERAVRRFPSDPFLRFTVEAALR